MDKKAQKQIQEQKNHDKFNNITQKTTPENQNQTHNTKKEGIQPINQKRESCWLVTLSFLITTQWQKNK